MIEQSRNNQIRDTRISANSRNHMYVILNPNYAHSASNIDVKFARLATANQSVLWKSLTFTWIFDHFSNFLTFPGFPGSVAIWSIHLLLWNSEHIMAVTLKHNRSRKFYTTGNHILLFSAFFWQHSWLLRF